MWWFMRQFGIRALVRYERERMRRDRVNGRKFDPLRDGEPLLRDIGATEDQIARAREAGLA